MSTAAKNELDLRVATLCAQPDHRAAAQAILEALGPEVLRLIHTRFRDAEASGEVFSAFAENLWRGLPGFRFRCSVRAWVFTLARNTGSRYLQRDLRKRRAQLPLSQLPELAACVRTLRSQTLPYLRSENRERLAHLRSELAEADQLLLTLHVERGLGFREIALVMLEDVHAPQDAVTREAARLRKRFQLIKERLRSVLQQGTANSAGRSAGKAPSGMD